VPLADAPSAFSSLPDWGTTHSAQEEGTDKRSKTVNCLEYIELKRRPRAKDLACRYNTTSDPSLPDDDDGGEGDGE
jgi:hypothetical protein